jgi:hypothetical protein
MGDKHILYIETTIPSYATGRTSPDVIVAGKQALTKLFWEQKRHEFNVITSVYTKDECARGDSNVAQRRLEWLTGIPVLPETEEIAGLAAIYQNLLKIPDNAKTDCFHLAICVVNHIDYLLTWNCRHLGIVAYMKVKEYNDEHGLWTPILATPEVLTDIVEETP